MADYKNWGIVFAVLGTVAFFALLLSRTEWGVVLPGGLLVWFAIPVVLWILGGLMWLASRPPVYH